MKSWSEYPFLRPALLFMGGIVVGKYITADLYILMTALGALCLAAYQLNRKHLTSLTNTFVRNSIILSCFFLLGLALKETKDLRYHRFHYAHNIEKENNLILRVDEEINIKKSVKTIVHVIQVNNTRSRGKLLAYFKKDSLSLTLRPGDIIQATGYINPTRPNTNPNAFQYAEYLKNRDIHYSAYFNPDKYEVIARDQLGFPSQYISSARSWGLVRLRNILSDDNQYAIAAAMILGVRNSISDELYKAYSETGSVHVLAVSGLHVGIITILFVWLFSWFNNRTFLAKSLKVIILISVVWSYAMITGAAPAVTRAALMFSLFTIGKYAFENYNIYNILAASAVILLTYDPNLLFQASFQFSFLALLSIVYFYEEINPHVVTPSRLVNKFISLGVVSIAAQVLVFPVTIFYFHKFPVYFILSGILAVFLATFILYAGLAAIFLYGIPVLGVLSQEILTFLLRFFIGGIFSIHELPFSSVNGIWYTAPQTILIYIGLIALMYWIKNKTKVSYIYVMLLSITGFLALDTVAIAKNKKNTSLVLYDLNREHSLLDVFTPTELYTYHNEMNLTSIEFAAGNHRLKMGKKEASALPVKNGVFTLGEKIFYVPTLNEGKEIPTRSDYLLLIDNCGLKPKDLMSNHKTDYVIVDKTVAGWLSKIWQEYCHEQGIDYYSVYIEGAFTMTF